MTTSIEMNYVTPAVIIRFMIDPAFQKQINQALTNFFAKKRQLVGKFDKRIPQLVDQIANVTLRGGDRLRPYLCWFGYQTAGGEKLKSIMPALLALELLHTFCLIHDDIMDEAETRRGGPTIHAHFTQNLRNKHQAISLAILAGDWSFSWAHELFDTLALNNATAKAKQLFDEMVEEVGLGQISDVWGMKRKSLTEIFKVYKAKSGNYSVAKPLVIGAILGGTDKNIRSLLTHYGEAVGLAFQLKDDLLGVFGEEKLVGKSATSDITEGKWTPLIAWTYERLDRQSRVKLLRILGNRRASEQEIDWLKTKMVATHAKERVEQKMQELVSDALGSLTGVSLPHKQKLVEIARFIIERST